MATNGRPDGSGIYADKTHGEGRPLEVLDGLGDFGRELMARAIQEFTESFRYEAPSDRTGIRAHVRSGHGGKKRKGAYKGSKAAKRASRKRR